MKAVLSDRIYMEVLPHTQKKIDDELTYSIPSFGPILPASNPLSLLDGM